MSFQARHRWIIQRLQTAFNIEDETEVEALLKTNQNMEALNAFFRADGPRKIFMYYQPRRRQSRRSSSSTNEDEEYEKIGEQSTASQDEGNNNEGDDDDDDMENQLFITDGESEALHSKAAYFLKKSPAITIDPTVADDDLLLFGTIDEMALLSLETILAHVHKPILEARTEADWGQADKHASTEFIGNLQQFINSLQENLKSMSSGPELTKPDRKYDNASSSVSVSASDSRHYAKLAKSEAAVSHFTDLLHNWCKQMDAYLDDGDQCRWESDDAGPSTELEYWKRRLQRLTGITEQLKNRDCKLVISVLTLVTKSSSDNNTGDKQSIFNLLRTWKQIDINLTEAANEAKDNVKYLATLEKFLEPLYAGSSPSHAIDALPALLNSVKMIHTIARYYNTTERMTKLFMKITNQMIILCKDSIVQGSHQSISSDRIWDRPPEELLMDLETCLRLNECYQEQYRLTKDKLLTMPKGKQFDFSENQIFGKFDTFCRRLIKLIDMFSTIHQFQTLSEHSLEGMEGLLSNFNLIISEFKNNKHDLLDYQNAKFDRDYADFNLQISDVESSLQQFINKSFESITSIEQSLQLLKQFQTILQRENLRNDLESKFTVIFHNYGLDLTTVQEIYEKYRHAPPIARNLPPVAGNIMWSRHLLKRIEDPMRKFESNPTVLATKDAKKIIKTYNKVARTLVAFEYLWYEAWCKSVESAKAGLHATLIIRHPETKKLYVNFDKEILQLIREAKCLDRMGIEIPESAKMVMLQEEKFKNYFNELSYALAEYDRVVSKIIPITSKLMEPHLLDLEFKIRPGMITLTWTSMNIDAYKMHIHSGLQRFEELVNNVNDIIENRIEKNLKVISQAILVNLPTDQSFALDEFVRMQERHVGSVTTMLSAKNTEVENALEDVLSLISNYTIDAPAVEKVSTELLEATRSHYKSLIYRSLVNCTKQSLTAIKKRVCSKAGSGFLFLERPFFEVDVQLSVPSVRLSPSLLDVQRSINRSAVAVLKCSKELYSWGQQDLPESERATFFDVLGCDTEIIKVAILLTGALHATKNQVHEYLKAFKKYDWLWKEDMELRYNQFMKRNPSIQDFENELQNFMAVEAEINRIAPVHNIAALSLNTKNLKLQLRNECRQWKVQYSDRVHKQARTALSGLMDYIRITTTKLGRDVESLDSLRFVMNVLKEIRERESTIEMEINPILDMYQILEKYLPNGVVDKEEMDQKSVIRSSWRKLVDYAEEVTDNLSEVQGQFKKKLISDVKDFQVDVKDFRSDYMENGPAVSGLTPTEAVSRLKRFNDLMELRERKLEVYVAGEELFAMRLTEYPDLVRTKKELGLLGQLYDLYMDVVGTMEQYNQVLWTAVPSELEQMQSTITSYDSRCRKLPHKLSEWEAYGLLRKSITDFQEVLPLIEALSKESIKPRHWHEIMRITETTLLFESETFDLKTVLESGLLPHKEEIEFTCESADKQLQIESKMVEIREMWAQVTFDFTTWKSRDVPILKGFARVIEDLEDAQLQLQTMLSMRHVTPFKEEVQGKLSQLSDTADILELWIKVQTLWLSLESVFTGGDIAKQMPLEAKKFAKIDKNWYKIMTKASETGYVVQCCANELLRNTLPTLYAELEKCQKSLEGYLEQKRNKFPRFYFVSNPVLLQILSRGSDPTSVQIYYEKLFDSIDRVVHDKTNSKLIVAFKSIVSNDEETVELDKPAVAEGNIEDWLRTVESGMQSTIKNQCRKAASDCSDLELHSFVNKYCGQFALLGMQFNWTSACQNALEKCKSVKGIMQDTLKSQSSILAELSSWCLSDLKTAMNRTKIEALITVQVHQRDCFAEMLKLFKERKLTGTSDFQWLKQVRFSWKTGGGISDNHGPGTCLISICDVEFKYSYEYLGCKERLVITPLTDRVYITLSQALSMNLGGAPAGPAGTGKTETVKDMGRALGLYVVVTNCTDQQRYTDMAKIFKGLCQAGLWGCFDEFNRIELPVLSVVAQQVMAITNAKRTNASSFCFPGDSQMTMLNPHVGYFITMNPGYQGRQELPENLKILFRSVAMMVPDREIIMKVKLCSVGYTQFAQLSRKFKTLYTLCEEQLSKQRHYDFGLRNILSVLRTAGKTKRDNLTADEEVLMNRTLRDMNLSKLVAQDIPLFLSLLNDIFPKVANAAPNTELQSTSSGNKDHDAIVKSLPAIISQSGLIHHPSFVQKVIQLYEIGLVRHGIMLVGPTASGKSEILKTLLSSLSVATKVSNKQVRMNPKAISAEEMFGESDRISGEWIDGVFASMWSKFNDRKRKDYTWIICDGPVDAQWIENLNTVLDDNKILTLANGDRVPMTDNCKLLFEVEDLRNASPATVSRTGIIYVSESDLDWVVILEAWVLKKPEVQGKFLRKQIVELLGPIVMSKKETTTIFDFLYKRVKAKSKVCLMESCLNLLDALLLEAELSESLEDLETELEKLVLFSITWAFGGMLQSDEYRIAFSAMLSKASSMFPTVLVAAANDATTSIFDFYVNPITLEWENWNVPTWEYPKKVGKNDVIVDFPNMIIPTIESTRSQYLLTMLHKIEIPTLLVGAPGTAKSTNIESFLKAYVSSQPDTMALKRVAFSNATTPGTFQSIIEGEVEKRGGKNFGPPMSKRLTVFLDDLSMPELNTWGDQPTLEIVRQLMEQRSIGFLDKDKRGDLKKVEDLQYVAAMSEPGNGKNDIPNRLKRHFFMFNVLMPSDTVIESIYSKMLNGHFNNVPKSQQALMDIVNNLTRATVTMFDWVKSVMLPTPSKSHYVFSMRELSRVFQGILRVPVKCLLQDEKQAKVTLLKLWKHECERVFADQLVSLDDKDLCEKQIRVVLETVFNFSSGLDEHCAFADFLRDDVFDEDGVLVSTAPKIYERGGSIADVRTRVESLVSNSSNDMASNLILFDDAVHHILRISRVLGLPRGNLLLVGIGGSGKKSLATLATAIASYELFQITLTKVYSLNSFLDDLRLLYKLTGQGNKKVTFLFTDADIRQEEFLEYLNTVLLTGEVTNLFPKDEMNIMASELRGAAMKKNSNFVDSSENLRKFFIDRVRENLHIVLCMSSVHPKFAERCRNFPALVTGCTIDYFLAWPEEALITVSRGFMTDFPLECPGAVKEHLILHMGLVHGMTLDVCKEYYKVYRRHVYQTPKSFLSFLKSFKSVYKSKLEELTQIESSVQLGLQKLIQGAEDVEKMKVVLKVEEVKLAEADAAATAMLGSLEVKSMEAKKENDVVQRIKEACEADAVLIGKEKAAAEEDLANARPYLEEAERAVSSIKPNDLNELKKLAKPGDIIKLIFDCVAILRSAPLGRVEKSTVTLGIGKDKKTFGFILDSYQIIRSGMLADARFLQQIFHFSKYDKDNINEETIEFMMPYLELEGFAPAVAKNASKAAEGLCSWVRAMHMYYDASKMVKPKLDALRLAEGRLEAAKSNMALAVTKLAGCQDILNRLQDDFEARMAEKAKIELNAADTRRKMEQATALINGLASERERWSEDLKNFADRKSKLIGDCAIACAFISYCGPFNKSFRHELLYDLFQADLENRSVPVSTELDLTSFFVDKTSVSDWNVEGLPTDDLSIQNGLLVTKSSRFPLVIDPQGQALSWIQEREKDNLPSFGVTTLGNPKLKDQLEHCMSEGKALIIHDIEEELDPMLTPVLERNFIYRAKSKYISVADKLCEYNDAFMIYMSTRLPNPHFSPEVQAKTTVVEFTVTLSGLEEQLLGKVIQKEQRSLEEQLVNVQLDLNSNTKALLKLDALLLERLSASAGNLLDDIELIGVLRETKARATDVKEKLLTAADIKRGIYEKREQYRPIATRGAVLYFSIVDMTLISCMYQTSLDQFLTLFTKAMDVADKATLASQRVNNVVNAMTYNVYRYVNRGLYEAHKLSFVLIVALKILVSAECLSSSDITLFLKGGDSIDSKTKGKSPPFKWLSANAWKNISALSQCCAFYKTLVADMTKNESQWKNWYEEPEVEVLGIPDSFEDLLVAEEAVAIQDQNNVRLVSSHFLRLILIRFARPDRTILAVHEFIKRLERVKTTTTTTTLGCLGESFVTPVTDTVATVFAEMTHDTPVMYLLSSGSADPTDAIEALARKKRFALQCVSMGEGQEPIAMKAISTSMVNGSWVLLQNCHLGLEFMESFEEIRIKLRDNSSTDFRLFMTSEAHPNFPISLLQRSIKVTNEPPTGLRAGMLRSYSVLVDQEKLERVDSEVWRNLLYTLCFMHTMVQERRKFGPLGWNVPYEFNVSDLSACITFLEKHLYTTSLSWSTLRYMVAEVQYGGKITDDMDRVLFKTYGELLLDEPTIDPAVDFSFNSTASSSSQDFNYTIPIGNDLEDFTNFITTFPSVDSPEILGMHSNADLTFRSKEVSALLKTISETQRVNNNTSSTSSSSSRSKEDVVLEKTLELLTKLPADLEVSELTPEPMNIFLHSEVQQLQSVLENTRRSLKLLTLAIKGEALMTPECEDMMNCIYDGSVPTQLSSWSNNNTSISKWIMTLLERYAQLKAWVDKRPNSFWLAGFFNPAGFLTAMKQEVTRSHVSEGWALDEIVVHTEVSEYEKPEHVRQPPKEGVFVHGLYLDGAAWYSRDNTLGESQPKEVFTPLPVLYVTALTKIQRKNRALDYGPYGGGYECPVYKYKERTAKHLVLKVTLPTREHRPSHWVLRGVALLCSID